jgi:hypothetical protein
VFILSCYTEKELYVNSETGLKLRTNPDMNSEVIIIIPFAEKVKLIKIDKTKEETINGIKSNWYKIKYLGKNGWAFGGYLGEELIVTNERFKKIENNYLQIINSKKDEIKDFTIKEIDKIYHYSYKFETETNFKANYFIEIRKFNENFYEEKYGYEEAQWIINYKKLKLQFDESINLNSNKIKERILLYNPNELYIGENNYIKYIVSDDYFPPGDSFSKTYFLVKNNCVIIVGFWQTATNSENFVEIYKKNEGVYGLKFKEDSRKYIDLLNKIFFIIVDSI